MWFDLAMQPLHELLHRIAWDAEFGKANFALSYFDRVAQTEQIVPFASISIDTREGWFTFQHAEEAALSRVPLHRVRAVYRDGVVIWRRPGRVATG